MENILNEQHALGPKTWMNDELRRKTHPERNQPCYDDARGVVQLRRHARECLAPDDTVHDAVALHGEHIEHARDDGTVISMSAYERVSRQEGESDV